MAINVITFHDPVTATFTHLVTDPITRKTAVIDSVMGYDQYSGNMCRKIADQLIDYVRDNKLIVEWILDTHIHGDHLTAASYLKEKLGGRIGISANVKKLLKFWVPVFNNQEDTPLDGSQFDRLFEDGEIIKLGNVDIKVVETPGHTESCVSYFIEDAIFVGDIIFMPDVGTARTDFPGGDAGILYDSIQKIFKAPDETKLYLCHDYPPTDRPLSWVVTIKEQKQKNILIHSGITKEEYVKIRNKRNEGSSIPKLLLPSLQINLRAGGFGRPDANNVCYMKTPIDRLDGQNPCK